VARSELKEGIFSTLSGDATLLSLLGTVTTSNRRIYSGWPQEQPVLSGLEGDEGWMVYFENDTTHIEIETFENIRYMFFIYATRLTLADDVVDIMDSNWNWRVDHQKDIQFGSRIVIRAKRMWTWDQYDENRKLHRKQLIYWFKTATDPWES
jgi:hypothetical protein